MVNDIFDGFRSERMMESRIFIRSKVTKMAVTSRKKLNLFAFLALGIANALAVAAPSAKAAGVSQNVEEGGAFIQVGHPVWSNTRPGDIVLQRFEPVGVGGSGDASIVYGNEDLLLSVDGSHDDISSSETPAWVKEFVQADMAGLRRDALNHLMDAIDIYEEGGDWQSFSDLLRGQSWNELSETALLGVLRNSYVFREKIPAWTPFAKHVSLLMEKRGGDVSKLMSGLLV